MQPTADLMKNNISCKIVCHYFGVREVIHGLLSLNHLYDWSDWYYVLIQTNFSKKTSVDLVMSYKIRKLHKCSVFLRLWRACSWKHGFHQHFTFQHFSSNVNRYSAIVLSLTNVFTVKYQSIPHHWIIFIIKRSAPRAQN